MKAVIQVAVDSKVIVGGNTVGAIDKGYVILLGVERGDTEENALKLLKKLLTLRINPDENGKTNLNIIDAGGKLLVVPQFTLAAEFKSGNRPSFHGAPPDEAKRLWEFFCDEAAKSLEVERGEFGAEMLVSLTNVGPATYVLEF